MAVIYIEYRLIDHPVLTSTLPIEDLQLPEKKYIFVKYYYKLSNNLYIFKNQLCDYFSLTVK